MRANMASINDHANGGFATKLPATNGAAKKLPIEPNAASSAGCAEQ